MVSVFYAYSGEMAVKERLLYKFKRRLFARGLLERIERNYFLSKTTTVAFLYILIYSYTL